MSGLKLYIWRKDVLCDYTCGMVIALAHDLDEAQRMIRETKHGHIAASAFSEEPEVFTTPVAAWVSGGG